MGSADSSSSNSSAAAPGDVVPPAEKKYKPLNTTPNTTKEIKVKIIPPQRESGVRECALIGSKLLMGMSVWDIPSLRGPPPFSFDFLVS